MSEQASESASISNMEILEHLRKIANDSGCDGFARLEALRVLFTLYCEDKERRWPMIRNYNSSNQ